MAQFLPTPRRYREKMKKLAIVFAVGVTALLGGTAANADTSVKSAGAIGDGSVDRL